MAHYSAQEKLIELCFLGRTLCPSRILNTEVQEVVRFLLTRFGTAECPFLPAIPIGQKEIVILTRAILASRIPHKHIFQHDAKAFAVPQEAMHTWEFPVVHFPGPEEHPNCYHCWGHGATPEGQVGILTISRVLRSSAEAVQVAPHDDVLSLSGQATQDVHYEPSKLEFVSKLHHSTKKNSAGVVVGGFMGNPHHKTKSSSTVHEGHLCKFYGLVHSPSGDKRWAIREAAGRIRIWVLSSTHSAQLPTGDPSDLNKR